MYQLPTTTSPIMFPENYETNKDGLLAIGGNLHPLTLTDAYSKGIFPWFSKDDPILWWCPHPRLVIFPKNVHFSRKMCKIIDKISFPSKQLPHKKKLSAPYKITINQSFHNVISECAHKRGPNRTETWIHPEMINSYQKLHNMGYAHSVEVWDENKQLVGGLYGIALGKIFFGESMFSHKPNTSKLALYWLCNFLIQKEFLLIDCQVETNHLKSLGAKLISRDEFLKYLTLGIR